MSSVCEGGVMELCRGEGRWKTENKRWAVFLWMDGVREHGATGGAWFRMRAREGDGQQVGRGFE